MAAVIAPANDQLAFDLLAELVRSANKNDAFTENGNAGFNADVFKLLAARDESRSRQSAEGFCDRPQRIAALASVYRLKADALAKRAKPDGLP